MENGVAEAFKSMGSVKKESAKIKSICSALFSWGDCYDRMYHASRVEERQSTVFKYHSIQRTKITKKT